MSTLGVGEVPDLAAHTAGADVVVEETAATVPQPGSRVNTALEAFVASVHATIENFRRHESVRIGLNTPSAELPAALLQRQADWAPVIERMEEVFKRFRGVSDATEQVPIDGFDSAQAREHAARQAQEVLDLTGYQAEFSSLLGKLSPDARTEVTGLLPKLAAEGTALLQAYNEKSAPWIQSLEQGEAEAQDRRDRLERAPHIRTLRDEVVSRCFRTFTHAEIVSEAGEIERQIVQALNPERGEIDSAKLRTMAGEIAKADLEDGTRAFLTEICHSCLVEASRVNNGDLSGCLSENILALRLQNPEIDPAQRTGIRIDAFRESFAAAVDQYNADNALAPLSMKLIETARGEFIKLLDPATGTIVADREARCRGFLREDNDLHLPKTGERVPPEQRKFLREQLDIFVAEPRPVTAADLESLMSDVPVVEPEVVEVARGEPEVLDTSGPSLHRDKEVKLPHGVAISFDVYDDGVSVVRISDALTASRAEYTLGTKTNPPEVAAALLPLRERLRSAAAAGPIDAALLQETTDTLNALADGPAVVVSNKLIRADHYFGPGGAKKGGLRVTDQPKPTEASEILSGTRRVTLTAEKVGAATAWSSIVVERDTNGVYVTLRCNENLLPRGPELRLQPYQNPAEVKVRIADASIDGGALGKKINTIFANMSTGVLERPNYGTAKAQLLGSGEMLERVLRQGELVHAKSTVLAGVNGLEINLAPAAQIEMLTLVGSKLSLIGKEGAPVPVQFRNVLILGKSEISAPNLQGSDWLGVVTSADSAWKGDASKSTFSACKFHGDSAQELAMDQVSWLRGPWPGGFNFPPGHAKLARIG